MSLSFCVWEPCGPVLEGGVTAADGEGRNDGLSDLDQDLQPPGVVPRRIGEGADGRDVVDTDPQTGRLGQAPDQRPFRSPRAGSGRR